MSRLLFSALLFLIAAGAGAEPVKCVDASGKVRYVDSTAIGAETCKAVKEGINTVTPQAAPSAAESREMRRARPRQASPSPDSSVQNEARLAEAQEKLAEAQKNLAEQKAIRLGGERNYARVEERLQPFQEAVQRAQQEVEQLRRESR
jgi:hypothetical protein